MAQESVEGRVREVLASWTVTFHGEPVLGTDALVQRLIGLIDEISDEAYVRGRNQGEIDEADRHAAALDADY